MSWTAKELEVSTDFDRANAHTTKYILPFVLQIQSRGIMIESAARKFQIHGRTVQEGKCDRGGQVTVSVFASGLTGSAINWFGVQCHNEFVKVLMRHSTPFRVNLHWKRLGVAASPQNCYPLRLKFQHSSAPSFCETGESSVSAVTVG